MFGQFTKFVSVGVVATGIHYMILIIMTETGFTSAVIASAAGYVISSIFNYLLNYYFTFSSRERHVFAALKFTVVASAGLALNSLIMILSVVFAGIHYLPGQILATGCVLVWNYLANRHWTYRSELTRS